MVANYITISNVQLKIRNSILVIKLVVGRRCSGLNERRKSLLPCTVLAAVPHCLSSSTFSVLINNYSNSALTDSACSVSYIDYKLERRLKLKIKPVACYITLAISSKRDSVKGICHVNIYHSNWTYENTILELIQNPCREILLSFHFQKQHTAIIFLPELKVNELKTEIWSLAVCYLLLTQFLGS